MDEVKSPIDLKNLKDARTWAVDAMEKRPYRVDFFKEFQVQLTASGAASLLELGSGPGFLASYLLNEIPLLDYTAYDFSEAMHLLAKERLGENSSKVNFIVGSFKEQSWEADLGQFDAVITLQAVHEIRHKDKSLDIFRSVKNLLKEHGIFLYGDHFYGKDAMQNSSLYMSTHEQEHCLRRAGFSSVSRLLSIGTLNLWLAF